MYFSRQLRHTTTEKLLVADPPTEGRYVSPPHLRTETDVVSETLCFLVSKILDDG
jgi:hypothetical protein